MEHQGWLAQGASLFIAIRHPTTVAQEVEKHQGIHHQDPGPKMHEVSVGGVLQVGLTPKAPPAAHQRPQKRLHILLLWDTHVQWLQEGPRHQRSWHHTSEEAEGREWTQHDRHHRQEEESWLTTPAELSWRQHYSEWTWWQAQASPQTFWPWWRLLDQGRQRQQASGTSMGRMQWGLGRVGWHCQRHWTPHGRSMSPWLQLHPCQSVLLRVKLKDKVRISICMKLSKQAIL